MIVKKESSEVLRKKVSEYLNSQYIEWEKSRNKRGTISEFASYLGVNEKYLAKWMNGAILPRDGNAIILANTLGPEIYDILGWPRPKVEDPPPVVLPVVVEKPNKKKTRVGQTTDPALALNSEK